MSVTLSWLWQPTCLQTLLNVPWECNQLGPGGEPRLQGHWHVKAWPEHSWSVKKRLDSLMYLIPQVYFRMFSSWCTLGCNSVRCSGPATVKPPCIFGFGLGEAIFFKWLNLGKQMCVLQPSSLAHADLANPSWHFPTDLRGFSILSTEAPGTYRCSEVVCWAVSCLSFLGLTLWTQYKVFSS